MDDARDLRENAVLASLPAADLDQLRPALDIFDVDVRHQVYEPGETIDEVFFPLRAVFSLLAVAEKRAAIEVATIGREGMVGLPLFLGAVSTPHAAFCQIAGPAARMSADNLRHALASNGGSLHQALRRFTQATMVQIAQNVVCNNSHVTEARAARWLLMTVDRVGNEEFSLTQEFLAQMLGVSRSTVSDVAGKLQSDGLIKYSRGVMSITDHDGLLERSCACYDIIKAEFESATRGS
jgi:CRP-like cAMP-binding protein